MGVSIDIETPTKLDLGCGANALDGFTGVDGFAEEADIKLDLLQFPWPFDDNTVEEVHCSHFVEHIPHRMPEWGPGLDGLWRFMDEVWRICKHDAQVRIVHPHANSDRADQDWTHERRLNQNSWNYANRAWREANQLSHYMGVCNFEIVGMGNNYLDEKYTDKTRHPAVMADMISHAWNIIGDMAVDLRAIKE
jgi:predicted SAM-dependent methyltransferase